jgi:hypothetical protein
MTDEHSPEQVELRDALRSIRETGESAGPETPDDDPVDPAGNPPTPALPDWGSDGIPAEDEPENA